PVPALLSLAFEIIRRFLDKREVNFYYFRYGRTVGQFCSGALFTFDSSEIVVSYCSNLRKSLLCPVKASCGVEPSRKKHKRLVWHLVFFLYSGNDMGSFVYTFIDVYAKGLHSSRHLWSQKPDYFGRKILYGSLAREHVSGRFWNLVIKVAAWTLEGNMIMQVVFFLKVLFVDEEFVINHTQRVLDDPLCFPKVYHQIVLHATNYLNHHCRSVTVEDRALFHERKDMGIVKCQRWIFYEYRAGLQLIRTIKKEKRFHLFNPAGKFGMTNRNNVEVRAFLPNPLEFGSIAL